MRWIAVAAVFALLVGRTIDAQEALQCSWTDAPIVAGVTPLRALHINEIRACLDRILAAERPPARCVPPWRKSGIGTFFTQVPACVDGVKLQVDWHDASDREGCRSSDSYRFGFISDDIWLLTDETVSNASPTSVGEYQIDDVNIYSEEAVSLKIQRYGGGRCSYISWSIVQVE